MTTSSRHDDAARVRRGRALGWLSGMALLIAPWVAAGILATAVTTVGPERWDAETTFPWFLLAAFSAAVGWIVYGSARIDGFRRGAVPGTAFALVTIAAVYVVARVLSR